jgi:xanthine dehydrogenase accessory factor
MSTNDWSTPETEVFEQIDRALTEDAEAVLATVVDVEGSAYRRPGAKMLLWPDGGGVGSITAGCLEDEVRALAEDVLAEGIPRIETWDLTGEDDVWGLGVGCNGVITVLLEPLGDSYRPAVEARRAGEPVGVATVLGGDGRGAVGERAFYHPEDGFEVPAGSDFPAPALEDLGGPTETLVAEGKADSLTLETSAGSVEVFVDGLRPPDDLVVFGSGHDVSPVVELAKQVDFRVTVVTFRGGRADSGDFSRADEVVSASPRDVADLREWTPDTHAVVMTHNFLDDRIALEQLFETPVGYIGLMGPQKRFEEMCEDFENEGRPVTEAERERVYTPIGLSLGGDTPYQIAFSIVAELLAVANDRTPQHLSRRTGPIHERVDATTE